MKLLVLILFLLAGCSDHNSTPTSFNSTEPTLQSAEDANTKQFTEESFK